MGELLIVIFCGLSISVNGVIALIAVNKLEKEAKVAFETNKEQYSTDFIEGDLAIK